LWRCEDLEGNLVVGTYGDWFTGFDAQGKATHISQGRVVPQIGLSLTMDREGLPLGGNQRRRSIPGEAQAL